MIRRLYLILSVSLMSGVVGFAQAPAKPGELPRRAWFGVALAPHESGAVVTAVVQGSSAEAEGIQAGDVIRHGDLSGACWSRPWLDAARDDGGESQESWQG